MFVPLNVRKLTVDFPIGQVFLLRGRLIFGPDAILILQTVFAIVAPVAAFCVFIVRKLMDEYSDIFGISIMAVTILLTIFVSPASLIM